MTASTPWTHERIAVSQGAAAAAALETLSDRADCCSARALFRAVLPLASGRTRHSELLLCGHHFRVQHKALAAIGATTFNAVGTVAC